MAGKKNPTCVNNGRGERRQSEYEPYTDRCRYMLKIKDADMNGV